MCGFVGLVGDHGISEEAFRSLVLRLKHRGPDGTGMKTILKWKAHLGHVRLAVIDTSEAGAQPMQDSTGNLILVFNGEIYNFVALRHRLRKQGATFTTESDAEVLLEAYKLFGNDVASHLEGMFAFAILDRRTGHVFLARDRFGVKPLYYHISKGTLCFASELKALLPLMDSVEINASAKSNYFKTGYVPAGQAMYVGVESLAPGHYLQLYPGTDSYCQREYWSAAKAFSLERTWPGKEEVLERVRELLRASFALRMVSDVPVGVFLSGGIDSTLLAAILKTDLKVDFQTFTIGFEDPSFDESGVAQTTSSILEVPNRRTVCTYSDFRAQFRKMYRFFDEPFADSSTPLTMLVSQIARQHVTVSLSADGADELFGGYTKYYRNERAHRAILAVPRFGRSMLGAQIERSMRKRAYRMDIAHLGRFEMARNVLLAEGSQHRRVARIENVIFSDAEVREYLPSVPICNRVRAQNVSTNHTQGIEALMLHDMGNYMVGDILKKVDMSTMAYGLEGREPYLDHKLCKYLGSLDPRAKFSGGSNKAILRELLYQYIPEEVINLPKRGFGAPLVEWAARITTEHRDFLETVALADGVNASYLNALFTQSKENTIVMGKLWALLNYYLWEDQVRNSLDPLRIS